jgi:2-phospho-L-lactate guanylyltransferase
LRLTGAPGLRRDVDTPADVTEAVLLGVGPSTAAVLDQLGLAGAAPPRQGTMRR